MKTAKKVISVILSILIIAAIIPATIFAATGDTIWVGGVEMEDGDYLANGASATASTKPSGGYAYFKDGELTLNNYVYEGAGVPETNGYMTWAELISYKIPLTLNLKGDNKLIFAPDSEEISTCYAVSCYDAYDSNLTVEGDGKLSANAERILFSDVSDIIVNGGIIEGFILALNKGFIMNGGYVKGDIHTNNNLIINGGTVYDAYISSYFGDIIINGGNILAVNRTEYDYADDTDKYAIQLRNKDNYGSITFDPSLVVKAATEPDGVLVDYVAANHKDYDLIVIGDVKRIIEVEDFDEPLHGASADRTFTFKNAPVDIEIYTVRWWLGVVDEASLTEGTTYELVIFLRCEGGYDALKDYEFRAGDIVFENEMWEDGANGYQLCLVKEITVPAAEIIDTIEITDLVKPVGGEAHVNTFTIPENAPYIPYGFSTEAQQFYFGISYHKESHKHVGVGDIFESGETYVYVLAFNPLDGYKFAEDVEIIINGEDVAKILGRTDNYVQVEVEYQAEYKNWNVTAENATASKDTAKFGEKVVLSANKAPEGKVFDKWEFSTELENVDIYNPTVIITMPDEDFTATATYKDIVIVPEYNVTVVNGTASVKTAEENTTIVLLAAKAPEGKEFDKWVFSTDVDCADVENTTTFFTMPASDVTATATYKDIVVIPEYNITATNATVSKEKAEAGNSIVAIADTAPAGKVFDKWVFSSNVACEDIFNPTVIFTMPEGDVTVEATYKTAPINFEINSHDKIIKCGNGVKLSVTAQNLPEGATIEWKANNSIYKMTTNEDGSCDVKAITKGTTIFTARIKLADGTYATNANGNIIEDTTEVTAKFTWWQWLIGGILNVIAAILGIIAVD